MTGIRTVAVLAPLYPPAFKGGGPIRSIAALVATAPADLDPLVLTSDRDLGASEPMNVEANRWCRRGETEVFYASMGSPFAYWRSLRALRERKPVLLHLNSFMNPKLSIIPVFLASLGFWGGARILLSPRGEFGDGALRRRSLKKRAYIRVFRWMRMPRRVIWHSTAPHETADIRRIWGDAAKVLEHENDTLLAPSAVPPSVRPGPLRAAFVGRVVEHKGLHLALMALADVAEPVRLDIYGSREDVAYAERCETLAAGLPGHVAVSFHGPLDPERVVEVLSEHDVLFMPTAGENFGHVIVEALSASCAIAVTPFTPWTDALQGQAGIILDRDAASWAEGISRLASETLEDRLARRSAAGAVYEAWTNRPRRTHVWSAALEAHPTR